MRIWYQHFVYALTVIGLFSSLARASEESSPLTLSIEPIKAHYMVGEPLHLTVAVASRTRERLPFTFSTNLFNNNWISFQTINAETGKIVGSHDPVQRRNDKRETLSTGPKPFRVEVIANRAVMPRKPGIYRITAGTLVQLDGPDGKRVDYWLTAECQVEIVLAKQRILKERAEKIPAEFETRRRETLHIPPSVVDAPRLTVDYLLACPEDIGHPILEKMIAVGWGQLIVEKMQEYPYSESAVRLLTCVFNTGSGESSQGYAFRILYQMYYDSVPGVRTRIEQIGGEQLTVKLRRQFAKGIRPGVVSNID